MTHAPGTIDIGLAFQLLGRQIDQGFTAVDRRMDSMDQRLSAVCDKGGKDHDRFDAGLDELNSWRATLEGRAQGRGQVASGFSFTAQTVLPLVAIGLSMLGIFKDSLPTISVGPSASQRASTQAIRSSIEAPIPPPADLYVAQPPSVLSLRDGKGGYLPLTEQR